MIAFLFASALGSAAPAAVPGLPITAPANVVNRGSPRDNCPAVITPDALICRALEAQRSGDNAAAARGFEEAAKASSEKDPRTARMFAAAGNLWIAADQPAKASADLEKALSLPGLEGPQRGEALLDRARAAEAQDDLAAARSSLNLAAATISADPFYWYFSAALAIREHDGVTARSAIQQALKLAPDDPAVLFEAGHVADFSGDRDSARSYWMKAAAGDPNGPVGKSAAKAIEMLGVTPTVKADATPKR